MDCCTPGFPVLHSLCPRVCSNSCPSSWWCHLTLCHCFLLLPSIFPSIRVFSSELALCTGGWSIRASASTSVLPVSLQGWFPSGWTGLIFLQSKGLSRVFHRTKVRKHLFFSTQPFLWSNSHICTRLWEKLCTRLLSVLLLGATFSFD